MARKGQLRVASEDDSPRKPLSILEAVAVGDYLGELAAMHRRVATAVADPNTPARERGLRLARGTGSVDAAVCAVMAHASAAAMTFDITESVW